MTTDPAVMPDPIDSQDSAAEVVRAMLSLDDISSGSVLFLLCDRDRRPALPIVVSDVPLTAPPADTLAHWMVHLGQQVEGEPAPALVFARARPGQSFVLDHDREWHASIVRACLKAQMPLVAAFVVTAHAAIPFPAPVAPWVDPVPEGWPEA